MSTLNSFLFQLVPVSAEEARPRVSRPRASRRRDDSRGSYLPQRFLFPKLKTGSFLITSPSWIPPSSLFHNPNITMLPHAANLHVNLPFLHCLMRRICAGKIPFSLPLPHAANLRTDFPMLPHAANLHSYPRLPHAANLPS